ncbi:MAG TPA: IMP dehydrogenase [Candidatus Paceibacterota bacterium]
MGIPLKLTYDDVLLEPKWSDTEPKNVNTETKICGLPLQIPILSAAMDTVTGRDMALALGKQGGLGVVHKSMSIKDQASIVKEVFSAGYTAAAAIGANAESLDRAQALVEAGCKIICIDSAHGHSKNVIETAKKIKKAFPQVKLIVGNIVTREAVRDLVKIGVDGIKVGIGPGAICTTRVVAGVGMPQLSAIMDVREALKGSKVSLIADGGIKNSGDIVKALAAGADAVMLGGQLAGTDEALGFLVTKGGKKYKSFRGMGSLGAMTEGSSDRYFQSEIAVNKLVPEGVEALVEYKGSLSSVLAQLVGGLRAGMGYIGATTVLDMRKQAKFVQITSLGTRESHPHDLSEYTPAPNYP